MLTLQDKSVRYLASHADEILGKQNEAGEFWPDSGFRAHFNTDYQQFAYYPLAYLFTLKHAENPWFEHPRLLAAVTRSLKNNLAIQQPDGTFLGSSHDAAPQPYANNWRSFTFLRTWELMRGHIGKDLESQCEQGLRKSLVAIEKHTRHETSEARFCRNHNVRNHPIWYLLATYSLGRAFNDEKATAFATEQFERVCAAQHPAGLWFEHNGPVAVYQHVSMSGLSHYHTLSGSPAARVALEKCLEYFRVFTYPSGHPVEVLDGRVRYTGYVMSIHPAQWSQSAAGRSHLHFLLDQLLAAPLGPGYQTHGSWLGLPFFTQFTRDLPATEPAEALPPPLAGDGVHELPQLPVRLIRKGPWTVTLSGFTRPEAPRNRWELDFQTHVSVHHAKAGLIIGGGGGKRQAALSQFTAGSRPLGLPCLALDGSAESSGVASARLKLNYSGFTASVNAAIDGDGVNLAFSVTQKTGEADPSPIFLQLTSPMKGSAPIVTEKGARPEMDLQDELLPDEIGTWIGREGLYKISGVDGARGLLHVLPYNTHWRDGRAPAEKAMSVVALPIGPDSPRQIRITAE